MSAELTNQSPDLAKTTHIYYFDYLRVWATIGVVLLHGGALIVTMNRGEQPDLLSRFNIGNGYDSLGRFGVSCFFMISGALLLSPQRRFRLRKQTLRVALPLIVWSGLYAVANMFFFDLDLTVVGGSNPDDGSLVEALKAFFTGPLAYHLWFVYLLVGIYLIVPLLRPLTALPTVVRDGLLAYGLALWLIFSVLLPALANVWPSLPRPYAAAFPDLPAGYVGIVLLGFYLHHRHIDIPRPLLVAGAAIGAGTTAALVYFEQAHRDGSLWAYNNLTPHVVLFAACVFLIAKSSLDRPGRWYPFVTLFSRLSFRIYLVHALVLHYLRSISPLKDWYATEPLIAVPVLVAITLVVSFAFAWAVEQIKPVRAYV